MVHRRRRPSAGGRSCRPPTVAASVQPGAGPAPARAKAGGTASSRRRALRPRRARCVPAAGARPTRRTASIPRPASRAGCRAARARRGARGAISGSTDRSASQEPVQRAPLGRRQPLARSAAQDGGELRPAGRRRRSSAGATSARARAAAGRPAQPLAQRGHLVGRRVPERGVAVLDVVVERAFDERDVPQRRAPSARSSGRGSARTGAAGTAARSRAGRAGTATPRR